MWRDPRARLLICSAGKSQKGAEQIAQPLKTALTPQAAPDNDPTLITELPYALGFPATATDPVKDIVKVLTWLRS